MRNNMQVSYDSSWQANSLAIILCLIPSFILISFSEETLSSIYFVIYINSVGTSSFLFLDAIDRYSNYPSLFVFSYFISLINGFLLFFVIAIGKIWFRGPDGIPVKSAMRLTIMKLLAITILFGFFIFSIFTLQPDYPASGRFERMLSSAVYESKLLASFWAPISVAMLGICLTVFAASVAAIYKKLFNI